LQRQVFSATLLAVDNQAIEARFGVMVNGCVAVVNVTAVHAILALDEAHGYLVNARVVAAAPPSERWYRLLDQFRSQATIPPFAPTGPLSQIDEHAGRVARDLFVAAAAFLAAEAGDLDDRISLLTDDRQQEQLRVRLDDIANTVGDVADTLIGRVEDGTWQDFSNANRTAFARRWADVIAGTRYVCVRHDELADHLLGLTQQMVDGALAVEFDPSVGSQVGIDMVAANFTGAETLGATLALIAEELPSLLRSAQPGVDVAGRVTRLAGSIAAGYVRALHDRSIDEQDAIYRVGLRARKQAEHALADSEAKFRAMFTKVEVGIGIVDLKGNIVDANPALLRMLGYTHEELAKLNVAEMVNPEDPVSARRVYRELICGERDQFRAESRLYRCDGSEIWADLTMSLVRDETGAPVYQMALLEDVSELHRLQTQRLNPHPASQEDHSQSWSRCRTS
jgi:PAS domain S-box-containing protein